jgi:hypothetical protein
VDNPVNSTGFPFIFNPFPPLPFYRANRPFLPETSSNVPLPEQPNLQNPTATGNACLPFSPTGTLIPVFCGQPRVP